MRWDIDKALKSLGGDPVIARATLTRGGVPQPVWSITFSKYHFHGRTIHEAYLNARKMLKKLPADVLTALGVTRPKKFSNSYASARRKKQKAKSK